MKDKTIFITGGAGFIASALIEKLVDNNRIIIYDNFTRDSISQKSFFKHSNLAIIKGDILDTDKLNKSLCNANIIIHAAAIAGITDTLTRPVNTLKVNMIGTANILDAALKLKNLERFIDFSTSEVFGSYAYKVNEGDKTIFGPVGEARWTYSVSKLAGEHLTHAYFKQFKLPAVTIRPFNIYGPGQVGEGAIHVFIRKALNNDDLFIFGDGSQIRAWCYIDDMINCIRKAMISENAIGESFNVGNSKAVTTIYGLAETVCRVLSSRSNIIFKDPLSADIDLRIPEVKKAKQLIDFEAKVSLRDGIIKTAEWYSKNLDNLSALPDIYNK